MTYNIEYSENGRKKALLTGGTSGVGLAILPDLLDSDFDVYFIGTSGTKGAQIEKELNTPNGAHCSFIQLDLSNLRGVRDFAQEFLVNVPKLDLLVNVAGVSMPTREVTPEGFEMTFAIDYFASLILCRELQPALEAASPSRIVNVAGDPRPVLKERLDFNDLMSENNYGSFSVMLNAVHAKTVLTEILAEELRPLGIDVNSFHPGLIKGNMARRQKFPRTLITKFLYLFATEKCASGTYASTAKELEGVTGQFFVKEEHQPIQFDKAYKDSLMNVTKELLKPIYAGA